MKQQLMLVAMLSVGTALTTMGRLKPVAASLTPPASYDYSYTWNATASEQYLNVNGVDSIPLYTRTVDGSHFNYTSTFNVVDGLDVTQTFNRSNTAWQSSGISYKPDEVRIGSDNTVGAILNKLFLQFDNQTNKDYKLFVDYSSSPQSFVITFDNGQTPSVAPLLYYASSTTNLYELLIPSYSSLKLGRVIGSAAAYFDAWYLQDLGISDSYQQGLDAETDGILTDYLGTDAQQIGWVLIGIAAILFAFKGGK
jgi:hypothetical protein